MAREFESLIFRQIYCPCDGIGIRTGLRNQVLRVRVSLRAPKVLLASSSVGSSSALLMHES